MQTLEGGVVLGRSREARFLHRQGASEMNKPAPGLKELTGRWGAHIHKMTVSSRCGQAWVEDHAGSTVTQPERQGGQRWVRQPLAFTEVLLSYRAYLIAAPSVFRSGVEEVISVTIFNSPQEVMVQAQLVAQGEEVAWSQGAILGRSLGWLTRASSSLAKWPSGLRRCGHCFASLPSHLPAGEGKQTAFPPTFQMGKVRLRRGSHLPRLGNQSELFLCSPGSVGADLDGVGHPSGYRWDRGPEGLSGPLQTAG